MKTKFIFLVILFTFLCLGTINTQISPSAQKSLLLDKDRNYKNWIDYPYREIFVYCNDGFPFGEVPASCFIQSRDEFNNICRGGKSKINFFREIVLGVKVPTVYPNSFSRIPKFEYLIKKDPETQIIHFMIFHTHAPSHLLEPLSRLG